jgi:hypothetical protein
MQVVKTERRLEPFDERALNAELRAGEKKTRKRERQTHEF